MNVDISILYLFVAVSFGLVGIGYLLRQSVPISLLIFVAGGLMTALFIMIDEITTSVNTVDGNPDLVHYEVTSPAVSVTANAITPIRAEYPSTSASQLKGDTFDCMSIPIAKSGAPVAGTMVRAGVWGTTGNLIKQFGSSLDVQNMSTGLSTYRFCLPEGETYTIGTFVNVERIGFEYNAGDAVNFLTGRTANTDPFDSTVTFAQVFTTATGLWTTPSTTNDLNMKIWLRGDQAELLETTVPFSEELKVFMVLMGVIMLLVGSAVEFQARRN